MKTKDEILTLIEQKYPNERGFEGVELYYLLKSICTHLSISRDGVADKALELIKNESGFFVDQITKMQIKLSV